MNRWSEQTVMLSSLISEKTVKKRGTLLSHSLPLSFICSFIRVQPSLSREEQANPLMAFPFTFRSPPPLLLSSFFLYSSLISLASHFVLAITMTCTCPPPPLLILLVAFIDFPLLFYPVISSLMKQFNNTISMLHLSSFLQKPNICVFSFSPKTNAFSN